MSINRGKQFERVIRDAFEKMHDVSVDRLHDQTSGYKSSSANPCDFIVYKKPHIYYLECKAIHGNTLNFKAHISKYQWEGLLEKSEIDGVVAGVICWWVDHDTTKFIPIQVLKTLADNGFKSIRYDVDAMCDREQTFTVLGEKKRVFFEYNMYDLLNKIENSRRENNHEI